MRSKVTVRPKAIARSAMTLTSRTASDRRIDSCHTMPLALVVDVSTRTGISSFKPRATCEWPANTALNQPARTGKASGGL